MRYVLDSDRMDDLYRRMLGPGVTIMPKLQELWCRAMYVMSYEEDTSASDVTEWLLKKAIDRGEVARIINKEVMFQMPNRPLDDCEVISNLLGYVCLLNKIATPVIGELIERGAKNCGVIGAESLLYIFVQDYLESHDLLTKNILYEKIRLLLTAEGTNVMLGFMDNPDNEAVLGKMKFADERLVGLILRHRSFACNQMQAQSFSEELLRNSKINRDYWSEVVWATIPYHQPPEARFSGPGR